MTKFLKKLPRRDSLGQQAPNTMLKYNYSFVFSDDINEWMGCEKRQIMIDREVTRRRIKKVIANRV